MSDENMNTKSFMQLLPEIRGGNLIDEVTEAIAEAAQAVVMTQKAADVTIKIKLRPGRHAENAIELVGECANKIPKPDVKPSMFFMDDDGSLLRNDPNQHDLPLHEVRKVQPIKKEQ
jgi:hypothetical protein